VIKQKVMPVFARRPLQGLAGGIAVVVMATPEFFLSMVPSPALGQLSAENRP